MKRYFLEYTSDEREVCSGTYNHLTGVYDKFLHSGFRGNSMKIMKAYIRQIRRNKAEYNPRDFRVYDYQAPDEPDGHVGQVYYEP